MFQLKIMFFLNYTHLTQPSCIPLAQHNAAEGMTGTQRDGKNSAAEWLFFPTCWQRKGIPAVQAVTELPGKHLYQASQEKLHL